jgi:hypothetical protein
VFGWCFVLALDIRENTELFPGFMLAILYLQYLILEEKSFERIGATDTRTIQRVLISKEQEHFYWLRAASVCDGCILNSVDSNS